jgi:uncharacterized protein (DUF1501 family)
MPAPRRRVLQLSLAALAGALVHPGARAAAAGPARGGRAKACILLFMHGGASQLDTFDPKPGRPTGGSVTTIPSAIPGVAVSEHLPGIARRLDRVALVRSLTAREGNHDRARYLMHTGQPPQGGAQHPALGAWVAEARGHGPLPGYVAIDGPGHGPGLLGAARAPFVVREPTKPVRNLEPPTAVGGARQGDRAALWRTLQQGFERTHPSPQATAHRAVVEQALELGSSHAVAAFDASREPAAMRERYGASAFGQGCLMARRLVQAGVPFVEVGLPGWDTHEDNEDRVRRLCGPLDTGLSALLDDLGASGLLDETLVVWMGDFGRTPRINGRGGRDHYPDVSSVLLAGGGIAGGQVVGATDTDGYEIAERPVTVPDLVRTIATALGIDPDQTRLAPSGRPIAMVDGGTVIHELL